MTWSAWEKVAGLDLKEIVFEKKYRSKGGGVARISSNRPQRMNALTNVGWVEFISCVKNADADKEIGVIVVSSIGDNFGVGGDVEWEAAGGLKKIFDQEKKPAASTKVGEFDAAVMNSPKPVIAAVKGYCIGGHNHLAYHCDLTIAADNAIFGQNGPRIGSPVHGLTASSLVGIVGMKRAKEIWMVCRQYTAQQALEMGLINAVVPLAKLEETVDQYCDEMLNLIPVCLTLLKRSFASIEKPLEADFGRILNEVAPDFFGRPEIKEAQAAFFEKRQPDFWKNARKS